ncbi:MAG: dockerin type I repeat-containing protein [candidate division Zixibacteria bacterium]|nr:dockerin type I repeat-containing protein [candidate division Zixibacteria bacterium]
MQDPIGSYWQNVWPGCCTSYELLEWYDNGSGYLDYCDYIVLAGGHDTLSYHVEAYETDIASTIIQEYICGDADGNGLVNIADVVYLITYIFVPSSPAPNPMASGDVNCDGMVNIADVVYMISYIFVGGPAPCDPNDDGNPDC